MFNEKQIQKYKRTKYTRELERFLNRIVGFFHKKETPSKEEFSNYIDTIFSPLEKIEKVRLNSPYLNQLESFVEKSANLPTTELEIDEIKKEVLHQANQLQKTKRKQNNSTPKHKGRLHDDH